MELGAVTHSVREGFILETNISDTQERITTNEMLVAETKKQAELANERAARFDADRALIEKEAEEIRSTNFVLQTKLIELEGKQLPRRLSDEQAKRIVDKLRQFKGTRVDFIAYMKDDESLNFANDILHSLNASGWVYVQENRGFLFGIISGVIVDVADNADSRLKNAASALVSSLQSEDVAVKSSNDSTYTNKVMVTVGKKP